MSLVDVLTHMTFIHVLAEKIDRKGDELFVAMIAHSVASQTCGHLEHALENMVDSPDSYIATALAVDMLKAEWAEKGPGAIAELNSMQEA